ncbi:MAG: tetratricopeptide repeat protein, partial [Saprospiraceae bacterium]|nr:tetratricopeptide repeat protein [Saprospiraceae bacterium]
AQAETEYEEALKIYRALAEVNPQAYLPDVAMTLVNFSIFYYSNMEDKEKSLYYSKEALRAALPFLEYLPSVQNYAKTAFQIIQAWGEDPEALMQQILDENK